jgi:F-type H+-transporting ATPase subunit gamma
MANTIALKRRIQSVKNTRQITKAMELVSASKMRRAQEAALRTRQFRNLARQILTRLNEVMDVRSHQLYKKRKIHRRLLVLITSDRGLAGAYNSNLLRQFTAELKSDQQNDVTSKVIVIGKQGARIASKLKDIEVAAVYTNFPEHATANDIRPILQSLVQSYATKQADAIDVIYTDYVSSINQIVKTERLLPAVYGDVQTSAELDRAIIEPSPQILLEQVTERLIEAQLNQAFAESQASEQSMRMMAMKNATDNATGLVDDLTLEFNTARQAAITQELAEITGGAEAIK